MSDLCDADILAWSERQGALLRRIAAGDRVNDADLDWPNIAEEIEDVGRSERRRGGSAVMLQPVSRPRCAHASTWRVSIAARSRRCRRRSRTSRRCRCPRLVRQTLDVLLAED
jgi:Domain of unknown function DUF29